MANLRADNLTGTGGRNAITGSVELTSDDGYLSTTLDAIGTSDFTIEWWFKAENRSEPGTANRRMFRLGANNATGSISINYDAVNNDIQWNYDATGLFNASTIKVYDNSWYHIAAVREGTGSNETKLYINGVLSDTGTLATDLTQTALQIGWDSTLGNDFGFYGNISNLRVTKRALYTAAFTPPTEKLRGVVDTILLCCQDSNDVTVDAVGNTITSHGNSKATKITPSVGVDAGVTFDGDTKVNTQGYMYFPTGDTSQRGRGRGLFAGAGPSFSKEINYIQIQSQGNTTKFGDLTTALADVQGGSSSTRGLFGAGGGSGSPGFVNTIEYVTIATTANVTDFGDLNETTFQGAALANDTRYVYGGGTTPTVKDVMDYVTIASAGNATDFGNLTAARFGLTAFSSPTRGIYAGGATPTIVNTIDYITIASAGNATDFGDVTSEDTRNAMGASSSTRGVIAGGQTNAPSNGTDAIDFLTIATTGNTTDFGNLTDGRRRGSGLSNSIRGVFTGGYDPSAKNTIDYITIASTGNAQDFGDYSGASIGRLGTSASDSHGGLS